MRKIQLRSLEAILSTEGLSIIAKARDNEPGKTEVSLTSEEAYLLFEFLYRHREELLKVRSQAKISRNTIDIITPKNMDQLSDEIDWVRHLSN